MYRGLWVVDGNFILEAARYLGYDAEAQQGLETTWKYQDASGGVFAGGGREHWKDTGIAMFTLVRQAELSQDWSYFREMQPNVERAVKFLVSVRDKARSDGSVNGRYGLLAPGFGDGGLGGIRSEFTNTLWVLAGLKAVTEATDAARLPDLGGAKQFYNELRASLLAAARQEMRRHPEGFEYLPMLVKEDAQWAAPMSGIGPDPKAPMGPFPCDLSRPGVREGRSRSSRDISGLMQACTARRYSCRNRLASARRSLELQRGLCGPCLPLGGAAGLGAVDVHRLPEPRHAALLLAGGTAHPGQPDGGLRR